MSSSLSRCSFKAAEILVGTTVSFAFISASAPKGSLVPVFVAAAIGIGGAVAIIRSEIAIRRDEKEADILKAAAVEAGAVQARLVQEQQEAETAKMLKEHSNFMRRMRVLD